jgi:hypothetical protein
MRSWVAAPAASALIAASGALRALLMGAVVVMHSTVGTSLRSSPTPIVELLMQSAHRVFDAESASLHTESGLDGHVSGCLESARVTVVT